MYISQYFAKKKHINEHLWNCICQCLHIMDALAIEKRCKHKLFKREKQWIQDSKLEKEHC